MRAEMVFTGHLLPLIFIWTASCSPGMAAKVLVPQCDQRMFDSNVDNCLSDFNKSMEAIGYQDKCPWPTVKRNYNSLKSCVDNWAGRSWCKSYGFMVDEVFLEVHQTYFSLCRWAHDPPLTTLIMLIAPAIIVTLFLPLLCVHLTTWGSDVPN